MNVYYVRGFTAATAATANHVIAELWNPGTVAGRRIELFEVGIFKAGAGTANDSIYLERTTARGTAGSTVTPDADNAGQADSTPPSGALLDLAAFTVQPTLATPGMYGWVAPAVAGAGIILPLPRGIVIPSGTGLAIVQRAATIWPTSEVTFVFED
jgi:hypothetical protein